MKFRNSLNLIEETRPGIAGWWRKRLLAPALPSPESLAGRCSSSQSSPVTYGIGIPWDMYADVCTYELELAYIYTRARIYLLTYITTRERPRRINGWRITKYESRYKTEWVPFPVAANPCNFVPTKILRTPEVGAAWAMADSASRRPNHGQSLARMEIIPQKHPRWPRYSMEQARRSLGPSCSRFGAKREENPAPETSQGLARRDSRLEDSDEKTFSLPQTRWS